LFLCVPATAICQSAGGSSAVPPDQTLSQPGEGEQDRSLTTGERSEQNIQNKDLFEKTGYLHPLRRPPRFVLADQKKIWTKPFRARGKDASIG